MSPTQTLQQYFGLNQFRHPQEAVIESILAAKDTMVIMPTGGGKSLCYQLPALLLEGLSIVISPLIALMKDQVDALKAKGIAAGMINSSQSWPKQQAVIDEFRRGAIKLVYIAPERFRSRSFTEHLMQCKISLVAVDEAHCISQWGHDFRPDYTRLSEALELLGRPPCIALTATATPTVRDDIVKNLKLREPNIFISGFARENLSFVIREIKQKKQKFSRVEQLIQAHKTGIIYCSTRKSVESVAAYLKEAYLSHVIYHGGLTDTQRTEAQNAFISKKVPIAVATNAFGMGIDRSDIRFVCHFDIPGSVEAYFQEAGRCGRDSQPGVCEFLFCYADKQIQEFFIDGANPSVTLIRRLYQTLKENADQQNEIKLSNDAISEAIGPRTNGIAVNSAISLLKRLDVIQRFDIPGQRIRGTRLLKPSLGPLELPIDRNALEVKRTRDEDKLKMLIKLAYAQNCRQQWILRYFGEHDAEPCNRCDNCANHQTDHDELNEPQLLIVKKALSGVARLSTRAGPFQWHAKYGLKRIIKCLLGSKAKDILGPALDKISTWGLLKEHSEDFLHALFQALERGGYIQKSNDEDYPLIELTEAGARVMLGKLPAKMGWPEEASSPGAVHGSPAPTLLKSLIAKRNAMSRQRGNVPAYTIFPNKVLEQLAACQPKTAEEAMHIKGIGPHKAKKILPQFLKIIAEF